LPFAVVAASINENEKKYSSLTKKANIQTGNKPVHFHALRKFCNDRLKNHMASEKADMIIGHSIGKTQSAYLYTEVRDCFARAEPDLTFNGNGAIKAVKQQVANLDTTVSQLVAMLAQRDQEITELKAMLAENTKTMQKVLDLPTIRAEMKKQKEKVEVD